jgi:hypothetical protein
MAAGIGIGAGLGTEQVYYLNETDLESVLRDFRARLEVEGTILFMVIPNQVASHLRPLPGIILPAAALVDLLSSADARQRHLAAELLAAGIQPRDARSRLL